MAQVLERLTNLIYPPECAGCRALTDAPHGLCADCWRETHFITGPACGCCGTPITTPGPATDLLCEQCMRHPPGWTRGRAAVLYEGRARDILLRFKHRDRLDLAPILAGWIARAGAGLLAETDLIAPVPLHWTRFLARRANQAAELARQPALSRHAPACLDLLTRRRRTRSLKGLDRVRRHAELHGAIGVNPAHVAGLAGKRVLLIDDVMTTGATLSACAEALRGGDATDVQVLVVARVAREDFTAI